jgi:ribosomal protein L11 methyltransferase
MNRRWLWKISVATWPEAEEAVARLLERTFGQRAATYTDFKTGVTAVTLYLRNKPDWRGVTQAGLSLGLEQIRRCGLKVGAGRVSLKKVRWEDWAESWKRHFKPLAIGSSLMIQPSWSRRRAAQGKVTVVIDPGLSFGTGQHPTTGFCLRQLAAWRRPGEAQSVLDMGTGSGILAIAAAKLGYAPVEAIDFDGEAVRIARTNAGKNRVADRIRFRRQEVTRLARHSKAKYTVVCANLVTDLLLAERGRILARLEEAGVLVLAGILKAEFARVRRAYESAGLCLAASRTEREWQSGAFVRQSDRVRRGRANVTVRRAGTRWRKPTGRPLRSSVAGGKAEKSF